MILYIEPHFTYSAGGGAGRVVLETAERLARKGLDVGVMTLSGREDVIRPYPNIKFFFTGGPLPNTLSHWLTLPHLVKRVNREISKLKVDILFPHVFPANYLGFLYKRKNRETPCVWYCHEPSAFIHNISVIQGLKGPIRYAALLSNPFFQLLDRKLVSYTDMILVNSHYTASRVRNIYHREATVVHPGVDIKRFKPGGQKEGFIFTVGKLTKFKKIDLLIRAVGVLKQQGYRNLRAVISGDGQEKANWMRLTRDLGLSRQVQFTGEVSDEQLAIYMQKARVVVFPTTGEPFGLVPLEAMACGTPVIASDSGGPRETVIDGKTGLLFKPDDEYDLASKLKVLLGDDNLAREMSINSRKHVEQTFTWDRTADKLYHIFSELMNSRKSK